MILLPSHVNDLKRCIAKKQLRESEFAINTHGPVVTFSTRGREYRFQVVDAPVRMTTGVQPGFDVSLNPGSQHTEERVHTNGWREAADQWRTLDSILTLFERWLDNVKRELYADRGAGDTVAAPAWATSPELDQINGQLSELSAKAEKLKQRLAVLWQTGDTLNQAVLAMFEDFGFSAQHTGVGATYDVLVPLSTGRRLLVEVTGIEGHLTKGKGGKIAQIVDAYNGAEQGDRVIVVVNAYRKQPPASRSGPLASDDALRLVVALDAVLLSTTMLYGLWQLCRTDADAARARIEELATCKAGVFV